MSVGYTDIARGGHPPRSARGTQPRPPPPVSLKQRTGRAATLRQPLPRQARPGAGCHDKHFLPLAPQPPPPSLWPPAGAPPTAGTGRRAAPVAVVSREPSSSSRRCMPAVAKVASAVTCTSCLHLHPEDSGLARGTAAPSPPQGTGTSLGLPPTPLESEPSWPCPRQDDEQRGRPPPRELGC